MTRVAITGIGVVSAIGQSRTTFWESLKAGRSGIGPIEQVDTSALKFHNGAEVKGFFWGNERDTTLYDRFALMAGAAAEEAIGDSGLEPGNDVAVITGSCLGGSQTEGVAYRELYGENRVRFNPLTIPRIMENAPASLISTRWKLRGPSYAVASACSSSNHAIGQAFWLVRNGMVRAAVAGGSDATFTLGLLRAWEAMRVVSPDTCRPFSKDRSGMVLGEGAAMLVLEPVDAARARGAKIWAEICGFGMSSDAHHITQPSGEGAARAMAAALTDGGVAAETVGYINAHGTGTAINDPTECQAIRMVFGKHTPAISSTKSMHGHTLGAAGAMEVAATVLALHYGILPPTVNFRESDPECFGDIVTGIARETLVEYALSNSFAFGGSNAALVFRTAPQN